MTVANGAMDSPTSTPSAASTEQTPQQAAAPAPPGHLGPPATTDTPVLELPDPPVLDELEADDLGDDIVEEAEQLLREMAPHDFEVLVIGAGPGGMVAALRAAQLGARTGLIEAREVGGVCLNRGCIPTKALLESIDALRLVRRAADYGLIVEGSVRPDFAAMKARQEGIVAHLRGHMAGVLDGSGVTVLRGQARFVDEHTVEVAGPDGTRKITAVHVIIATGGRPQRLPVPGSDLPGVLTSDEALRLEGVPDSLVVVGAGAVGVEFASLFAELGSRVTLAEMAPAILPQEDPDIGREMQWRLENGGIEVLTGTKLERIERHGERLRVHLARRSDRRGIDTALVLLATGRVANTAGLGLDAIGVRHERGRIVVDENCETSVGGVYAIGDCIRDVGWAHLAAGEGRLVAENIMRYPSAIDLRYVPSCYYTCPEIASVGLSASAARRAGMAVREGTFYFRFNGKAAAAGEHDGFVKLIVDDATDRLFGCQIIGPRATEIINEAVLALRTGQTIEELIGAIHAHPTFSEALPEAALAARRIK